MTSCLQTLRKPGGCRPLLADTLAGSHGDEISCPAASGGGAGGGGRGCVDVFMARCRARRKEGLRASPVL